MNTNRASALFFVFALLLAGERTVTGQSPLAPKSDKSEQPRISNEQFLERMSGIWKIQEATFTGSPFKTEVETILQIEAGKFTLAFGENRDQGELKIDTSKLPVALDIVGSKGPNEGRTIPAIAKFDGDKLVICYELDSATRPEKFESPAGSGLFLAVYERAKAEPKK